MKLGPEFSWLAGFSAYDRPDIRLTDTDDPIRNFVGVIFVHVLLLSIDFTDCFQNIRILLVQFVPTLNESVNVFQIPANVTKLLLNGCTDSILGRFLGLGNSQKLFVSNLPLHPWLLQSVLGTEPVNHVFELLPGLIEQ